MRKTRYCEYYFICDRDEDCFNGEYCPFFKFNLEYIEINKFVNPNNFESIMDDIWFGKYEY